MLVLVKTNCQYVPIRPTILAHVTAKVCEVLHFIDCFPIQLDVIYVPTDPGSLVGLKRVSRDVFGHTVSIGSI